MQIKNQLGGESLTAFMSKVVGTFTSFPPLGVGSSYAFVMPGAGG